MKSSVLTLDLKEETPPLPLSLASLCLFALSFSPREKFLIATVIPGVRYGGSHDDTGAIVGGLLKLFNRYNCGVLPEMATCRPHIKRVFFPQTEGASSPFTSPPLPLPHPFQSFPIAQSLSGLPALRFCHRHQ